MKTRSDSSWRFQGSTLLFQAEALANLSRAHADDPEKVGVVSLRTALLKAGELAAIPGLEHIGTGDCTLVATGLDAMLQTLPVSDGERWLQRRVRPMIKCINAQWPSVGLVFTFPVEPASIQVDDDDVLRLTLPGRGTVALSLALWGASPNDLVELTTNGNRIGYSVVRVS